jgi:hypothetical protein
MHLLVRHSKAGGGAGKTFGSAHMRTVWLAILSVLRSRFGVAAYGLHIAFVLFVMDDLSSLQVTQRRSLHPKPR